MIRHAVAFLVGPHRLLVWCEDVLGIELEGEVPCIDLAERLGEASATGGRRLRVHAPLVDLLIDRVMEILTADLATRQPIPPLLVGRAPVAEIVYTADKPTYVLDLSQLVREAA